jgi:hypothetical protein
MTVSIGHKDWRSKRQQEIREYVKEKADDHERKKI